VAQIIAAGSAADWLARFEGKDVCCNLVKTLEEAMSAPQFQVRGVLRRSVIGEDDALPAVAVPVDEALRDARTELRYPALGQDDDLLGEPG
jgi:crotonobetainyl-CoA:carnitine CoA-transferase CaiB-like acyl-CoA transferase